MFYKYLLIESNKNEVKVKISKKFFELLKNFSQINKSIYFNESGYIKTITNANNVVAIAKIEEELPQFAIFDIHHFLQYISLINVEDANFEFIKNEDTKKLAKLSIKSGRSKLLYNLHEPALIRKYVEPKAKVFESKFNKSIATFSIPKQELKDILNACRVIDAEKGIINFIVKDGKASAIVKSSGTNNRNTLCVEFEDSNGDDCDILIRPQNIPLIQADYDCVVVGNSTIKFNCKDTELFYICQGKVQ